MEVDSPTPSLLERLGESRRGGGVRSTAARRTASAPYQKRRDGLGSSNADADGMWKHDRHEGGADGGSLAARLQAKESRPRADLSAVQNALRQVNGSQSISIKGASLPIVEVKGLVAGTTAEDVKAIFQSCGTISKAHFAPSSTPQSPHVLLHYENRDQAQSAVNKFNGLPADGQRLSVTLTSSVSEKVHIGKKNEDLLPQEASSGKLYSDQVIANDPRAQVVSGDFNFDEPAKGGRGGRGGRPRRGRGSGRRGGSNKMETDPW